MTEEESRYIADNIKYDIVAGKIILTIDPDYDIGPSSTGKMQGIASTGGFITLPHGLKMNLYLGRPKRKIGG